MKNKEKFKSEMHDYANLNEYFSYFGNVIYISSSFYHGNDYFVVIRTAREMSVVKVAAKDYVEFSKKKNRNDVVADLTKLESKLHWVVPMGFHNYVNGLLEDDSFPDKQELIRLKKSDINTWNKYFIEDIIKTYKKDHTLLSKGITFDSTIRNGYMTTFTIAEGVYGSLFSIFVEWVSGNPFFDIKIQYFSTVKNRRLQYYDVVELATLLSVLAKKNDNESIAAIEAFTS